MYEIKQYREYQQWFAHRAVAASVRGDRARLHIDAWLCRQAGRAGGEGWDLDRNAEVEALAAGLAAEPGRVAAELRRSLHGCRWLADRWRDLAAAQARARGGDGAAAPLCEAGRRRACDLLGLAAESRVGATPLDLPDGRDAELAAHQAGVLA